MSLKDSVILLLPGYFHIKEGRFARGISIALIFIMNMFFFIFLAFQHRPNSLFLFLAISTVLFYILDVIEKWPQVKEEDNRMDVSSNAYEEARIAMMTFDYSMAENLFYQALKNNPHDMDVLYQLAVLYYKKGEKSRAKAWLKKYLKQKKHNKWVIDAERLLGELENDTSNT